MLCEVISSIAIEIFGVNLNFRKEDDQQRIPRNRMSTICDDGTPWMIETPMKSFVFKN